MDKVVSIYNSKESFHIALSPEGTRKKVTKLKTGFYHIAKNANVPIIMVALNVEEKTVIFADPFHTGSDETADKQKIVAFFKGIKGYVAANSILEDIEG